MSFKPWKKDYDRLLEELKGNWRGDVKYPSSEGARLGCPADVLHYARYSAEIMGFKVRIEINEFPAGTASMLDAGDNSEYLRISIEVKGRHEIYVRHERVLDKIKKSLKLENEVQTGNAEFDSKYYLVTKSGDDAKLVISPEFQQTVITMEPFVSFRIGNYAIDWSQIIKNKSLLTVETIEPVIRKLIDLARQIKEHG